MLKNTFKPLIILCIFILGVAAKSFSQNKYNLEFEEFNIFFLPSKCVDTLDFKLSGKYLGYRLRLFLKDCRGEAFFELFDTKNELRMTGNYDNAIDTLKRYKFGKYLGESDDVKKYKVYIIQFLSPLKAREWIYYEGYGKKKKSRTVNYVYIRE